VCAFSAKHDTQVENEPELILNVYYVCFCGVTGVKNP
jgi:hypothetical protein